MRFHRNAKLGLAGRYQLVLAIEGGSSIRESASLFNVSARSDRAIGPRPATRTCSCLVGLR